MWFEWRLPPQTWAGTQTPWDAREREAFHAITRVTVGDRVWALFWCSTWICGAPLGIQFPHLFVHSRRKNKTVHQALTGSSLVRNLGRAPLHTCSTTTSTYGSYFREQCCDMICGTTSPGPVGQWELLCNVSIPDELRRAASIHGSRHDLEAMGSS
jgi:hypothetical protein